MHLSVAAFDAHREISNEIKCWDGQCLQGTNCRSLGYDGMIVLNSETE